LPAPSTDAPAPQDGAPGQEKKNGQTGAPGGGKGKGKGNDGK
jgi:hypothetical protein